LRRQGMEAASAKQLRSKTRMAFSGDSALAFARRTDFS